MKGLVIMRTIRSLLWVVLGLGCLLTIGVSVSIYQRAQPSDELLGRVGPTSAPAGVGRAESIPSAKPEEQFGREPSDEDVLHLWAKAATTGDYSTARLYMDERDIRTADWEQQHEGIVGAIRDYHISNIEVRGQTTRAVVRFELSSRSWCVDVQVNNITKRLSVLDPYRDCRAGE